MPSADGAGRPAKVLFWEVATRKVRARINGWIETMQFAADGKHFTICRVGAASPRVIQYWEITKNGDINLSLERQVDADDVPVSPNLDTFVTVKSCKESGRIIQLWDLLTGQEKSPPRRVAEEGYFSLPMFSPSGRFLVLSRVFTVGSPNRIEGEVFIWNTSNGLEKVNIDGQHGQLSLGERWIIVTKLNGAEVWNADGRGKHFDACRPNDSLTPNFGMGYVSSRADFSPDDRWLFTSRLTAKESINPVEAILTGHWNNLNGTVSRPVSRLWDVERREEIATFGEGRSAVFLPDSRTLLIQDNEDRLRLHALPPRQVGVPLTLTVATWGSMLLLCWAVKRRLGRGKRVSAVAQGGQPQQTGVNACHS